MSDDFTESLVKELQALAPILLYYVITFIVGWTLWFSALACACTVNNRTFARVIRQFGGASPTIAAMVVAPLAASGVNPFESILSLLSKSIAVQYCNFTNVMCAIAPPLIAAIIAQRIFKQNHPNLFYTNKPTKQSVWTDVKFVQHWTLKCLIQLPAIALEEIGWRGFVQCQLISHLSEIAPNVSLFNISIIDGVFWSIWHLPLLLRNRMIFKSDFEFSNVMLQFGSYTMALVCISMIQSFVLAKVGCESVVPSMLTHAVFNSGVMSLVSQMTVPLAQRSFHEFMPLYAMCLMPFGLVYAYLGHL